MSKILEDRKQWEDIVSEMFTDVFPHNQLAIQWTPSDMMLAYVSYITSRGDPLNCVVEIMPHERVLDPTGLALIKRRIVGSKGSLNTICHRRVIAVASLIPVPPTLSRMISDEQTQERTR